jgi:hypothetical protein
MAADSAGIDAVVRRIEHGRAEALAGMTIRDLAMMPPVIDKTPKNSI